MGRAFGALSAKMMLYWDEPDLPLLQRSQKTFAALEPLVLLFLFFFPGAPVQNYPTAVFDGGPATAWGLIKHSDTGRRDQGGRANGRSSDGLLGARRPGWRDLYSRWERFPATGGDLPGSGEVPFPTTCLLPSSTPTARVHVAGGGSASRLRENSGSAALVRRQTVLGRKCRAAVRQTRWRPLL